MLKYTDTKIVFREVPDEISLAINISGCPCRCEGCHSPQLREDIGAPLTTQALDRLIEDNPGITCICFMGGDAHPEEILTLAAHVKGNTHLKTCWYSGKDVRCCAEIMLKLDYYKTGHYDHRYGPLDSTTTNQRFYRIRRVDQSHVISMEDITYRFYNS